MSLILLSLFIADSHHFRVHHLEVGVVGVELISDQPPPRLKWLTARKLLQKSKYSFIIVYTVWTCYKSENGKLIIMHYHLRGGHLDMPLSFRLFVCLFVRPSIYLKIFNFVTKIGKWRHPCPILFLSVNDKWYILFWLFDRFKVIQNDFKYVLCTWENEKNVSKYSSWHMEVDGSTWHFRAVSPDSILLADQLQVLILIFLKMIIVSSKDRRRIILFKKFSRLRVNKKHHAVRIEFNDIFICTCRVVENGVETVTVEEDGVLKSHIMNGENMMIKNWCCYGNKTFL